MTVNTSGPTARIRRREKNQNISVGSRLFADHKKMSWRKVSIRTFRQDYGTEETENGKVGATVVTIWVRRVEAATRLTVRTTGHALHPEQKQKADGEESVYAGNMLCQRPSQAQTAARRAINGCGVPGPASGLPIQSAAAPLWSPRMCSQRW